MATLKDVERYGKVFIEPYYDNNKASFSFVEELPSIELSKAECLTLIELIEANKATLALFEENLQSVADLADGTPLLTTWLSLTEFNHALESLVVDSACTPHKSDTQSAIAKWANTRCNLVAFDFIRKR